MRVGLCAVAAALFCATAPAEVAKKVKLDLKLPKPMFAGTPKDLKTANLEAARKKGARRATLLVPPGTTNLAWNKKVTASDSEPVIGQLAQITDGDKAGEEGSYVELGPGPQYVQIDLGQVHELYAVVVWHFHKQARVYRDIVVQSAHDAGFKVGVTELCNNDHDNSLKMGRGKDKEYIETYEGRLIDAKGVTGRYVRLYSRGSTGGDMNHYVEVEVHGRPPVKPAAPKLMDRFFTLNISNGARSLPPEKRAALVKEAGYAGQCQIGTKNMPAVIRAMDAAKLRLFACYIMVNVRTGKVPADLAQVVEAMKKHKTYVWVGLVGAKPSTTDHDDKAVAAVREIAAIADKAGLEVALYPHVNFYGEKAADVLRIAKKVDRKNVGVTFNLCHFMKTQPGGDWKRALNEAASKLFIVTICGADTDGKDWKRLIMPLDQGTFDLAKLLAHLDQMGFGGLIGVQDYGIGGDPRDHLRRSMAAFRKLAGVAK